MKLSKTATLAALAVAYLSTRRNDGHIQARHVADYLHIPTDSALKVLQALARRGVINSHLGRSGGYYLENEPHNVTLLQIVEAVEGPIEPELPVQSDGNGLSHPIDQLRKACNRVAHSMRLELERTTVSELAEGMNGTAAPVLATIEEGGIAH
jgi:Rrf2 family protein